MKSIPNSSSMSRREFNKKLTAAAIGAPLLLSGDPLSGISIKQEEPDRRNERPTMTYRKLGRTNFMCSRLVFVAPRAGDIGKGQAALYRVERVDEEIGMTEFDLRQRFNLRRQSHQIICRNCIDQVHLELRQFLDNVGIVVPENLVNSLALINEDIEQALTQGLNRSVERGTLLYVQVENEDGIHDLYFLNSERGRDPSEKNGEEKGGALRAEDHVCRLLS